MPELTFFLNGRPILKEEITGSLSVGASEENDIVLQDSLQPRHGRVEVNNGNILLIPVEGQVTVNGKSVVGSAKLEDNDLIDIGPYRAHYLEKTGKSVSLKKKLRGRTATISLLHKAPETSGVMPFIQFLKPFKRRRRQVRLILGRGLGTDITVDKSYVSAQHAEIYIENGQYFIRDLDSRNGTFVNDQRVEQSSLPDRGTIRLGKYAISYEIEYPPAEDAEEIEGIAVPGPKASSPMRLIVGKSRQLKRLLKQLDKVAGTDDTVMLLGETGVGKDLYAQYLHYYSRKRKNGPLVVVNCATIPKTLAESQLFGHAKGSFTGAMTEHKGFFRQADGGTLFLDEIGELPPETQASLLRIMEDGIVRPVGSEKEVAVDVRLIAATNRDLAKEKAEGGFRKDLYERFDWTIKVPPLRHRTEDISNLVKYFLHTHSPSPLHVDKNTLRYLESLPWPGNIRALNRSVRRAITNALARGSKKVTREDFEIGEKEGEKTKGLVQKDRNLRRERLPELMKLYKGNVSRISRELGVSRLSVRNWCEKDGIDPEEYRSD